MQLARPIFKVKGSTDSHKLATAIEGSLMSTPALEVWSIGAEAVNQAMKAFIIVRSSLDLKGISISMKPYFKTVQDKITQEDRSAIVMEIRKEERSAFKQ